MMVSKIKNIFQDCLRVLPALLFILPLLTGCRSNNDVPDMTPSGQTETMDGNVTLDLSIGINGGSNQGTRAFDKEDNTFEPPASSYEIVNTLRVVIVRLNVEQADGTKKNVIEHNRMVNVSPEYADNNLNLITSYYVLHDNLRFNLIGDEMKTIYLFANEEMVRDQQKFDFTNSLKVGEEFPKDRVENLLIQREENVAYIDNVNPTPDNGVMKRTHYVPMSEAFNIYVPAPRGYGEDLYYQTLFMTRSLIKFSFSIAFDKGDLLDKDWEQIQNLGVKLKGVKITNLANSSYYLPRDTKYDPWKYWPEPKTSTYFDLTPKTASDQPALPTINTAERRITEFSVPANPGASEYVFTFEQPIKIVKQGTDEESYAAPAIYLPESKVTGLGNDLYYVSLIFDDESLNDQYGSVPLRGIDAAQTFTKDIPRNTHLKVKMVMNLKKHELEATATVFPYTGVWLNPEFGFIITVEKVTISERSEETGELVPVDKLELREGESRNLIGTVSPHNANNQDLVWVSADSTVVSVSETGLVKAKNLPEGNSAATVSITAMAADGSGESATCMVTVIPKISVESITISPTNWEMNIGTTTTLTATILPKDATVQDITWESNKPEIATVSSYGVVTAVGPGDAVITATATDGSGKSAPCSVHVNDKIPITSVKLSAGPSGTFYVGQQFSFNATVEPDDATNQILEWESDKPEIASVTSYGLVTAKALPEEETKATVIITAKATDGSGKSDSYPLIVTKPVPVTEIKITKGGEPKPTYTYVPGGDNGVKATIIPADATFRGITWTSSNENVITVEPVRSGTDDYGCYYEIENLVRKGAGTATITATSISNPEVSATVVVTVN